MKVIPKQKLDRVIELTRAYYKNGDKSLLDERIDVSEEISNQSKLNWLRINDFVAAIVGSNGFFPDAENDDIYLALRVFGWRVVDEVEESESL